MSEVEFDNYSAVWPSCWSIFLSFEMSISKHAFLVLSQIVLAPLPTWEIICTTASPQKQFELELPLMTLTASRRKRLKLGPFYVGVKCLEMTRTEAWPPSSPAACRLG
ncbi:hypothetical protein V6N13_031889 [Hibiscus sabdariffa]